MTSITNSAFGVWNAERVYYATANDACFDGRYMWTVTDSYVYANDFFGMADHRANWRDEIVNQERFIPSTKIFYGNNTNYVRKTNPRGGAWIAGGKRIWPIQMGRVIVALDYDMFNVFDYQLGLIATFEVSVLDYNYLYSFLQNGLVVDGFLWGTDSANKLFKLDLTTGTKSVFDIPARMQLTTVRRDLAFDFNGNIVIPIFNNCSIIKFNIHTSTFSGEIRLNDAASGTNKEPDHIFVNQDKELFVSSYKGMLSQINASTNVVTHLASFLGHVAGFTDVGSHFWCINDELAELEKPDPITGPILQVQGSTTIGRVRKSDKAIMNSGIYILNTDGSISDSDSTVNIKRFSNGEALKKVFQTPALTVPYWTGNDFGFKTIPKCVWFIAGGEVLGFEVGSLFRSPNYEIGAAALFSTGQYNYHGT